MSVTRLAITALVLGVCVAALRAQPAATFDVIVRGGTVFDGTGAPGYRADVALKGERIAAVGDLRRERGAVEIDANGLYVAPGFINIHSHPTAEGLATAENMLTQGVTTEILNPDGAGPIDLVQQRDALTARGLAVNVGAYIGFNSAWTNVVGASDRRPGPDEIARMRQIIDTGLEQGAWGVSAGLDYKPAYFATTREVVGVVGVAAKWRTNFTNHDRITPESGYSSRVGITETIAIGKESGVMPVVTHMKAQGLEQGTAPALAQLMKASTSAGNYTAADAYPYVAGQSGLGALIIPGWAQEGGRDAMLRRFSDPETRTRIVTEAEQAMKARFGGPEGVYVTTLQRQLTSVMAEMNVSGGEAIVRLLETRDMGAILRFGSDADVIALLQYPATSVACDCGAVAAPTSHPRYYGSFPRVLGRYVREGKNLTWPDAIRKMTGLPASTIGMVDRGFIAPGMFADVAVFDPATIIDHATFEEPTLPSEGMRYVFVNGRMALRDGKATGEHAGRALVRTAHMPSRPMRLDASRKLSWKRDGLDVNVRQDARARHASGSLRWRDPQSGTRLEATSLGILQQFGRWSSITGRGRVMPGNDERAFTLMVDDGTVVMSIGDR
jgi:N-acyl-D-aspartate/D-glutamate deacylase